MADVLVVERKAGLRETLQRLLVDAGHTVLCESDGISALTTLVQHPRPLVVLLGDTCDEEYNAHLFLTLLDVGFIPTLHAYVLIATEHPRALPPALALLCLAHHVPVVRVPIAVDVLLETVNVAANRLQAIAADRTMWLSAGNGSMHG